MDVELPSEASLDEVFTLAQGLLTGETNRIANLANLAALLGQYLPRINWAGFYLAEAGTGDWVLGPFWGKPACTRIPSGQGVVGTALASGTSLVVPDVHEFPGHIACDAASRSEIVVPIRDPSQVVVAGIDVDSPWPDRFGPLERAFLEALANRLGTLWSEWHGYDGRV
ncbi:MAG: GAF domain-containing protein [Sulfobacillus sp.]|nr:GAF domain-containing protein [Sulfobacillus sp.]